MLEELPEDKATGDLAVIYAEIRELTRVPYVSSLQRHLATRPGYLEWAWKVVAPIFRDHSAQSIGWEAADSLEFSSGNVTSEMEQYFSEHPAAAVEIKNIFHSFIRVSPTNLVVSYILKQRLSGLLNQIQLLLKKMLIPVCGELQHYHRCLNHYRLW